MADARTRRGAARRGMLEVVFALCTAWLVVQNATLLAWWLGSHAGGARGAIAIGRAVLAAAAPIGLVPAFALVGGALAVLLVSRGRREDWEANDGNAR